MSNAARPVVIWLACAVSLVALAWGLFQLLQLSRFGLISPLEWLLTAVACVGAVVAVWLLRWWGLVLAALVAAYVVGLATYASVYSAFTVGAFYLPLMGAAVIHHKQFRW